jgi:thioredoxin-dependent peroxiredoxin
MAIKIGDHFPGFTLNDHNSNAFDTNSLLGKTNLIIYFYPKNETYNCTKQACNFRDDFLTFRNLDCEIIGVSNDSPKSHLSFKKNHNLPFTLLSDRNGEIQKKLELPRNIFGLIPGRITFVIDKKGIVIKIIDSAINMRKHIEDALNSLSN